MWCFQQRSNQLPRKHKNFSSEVPKGESHLSSKSVEYCNQLQTRSRQADFYLQHVSKANNLHGISAGFHRNAERRQRSKAYFIRGIASMFRGPALWSILCWGEKRCLAFFLNAGTSHVAHGNNLHLTCCAPERIWTWNTCRVIRHVISVGVMCAGNNKSNVKIQAVN